ncbi:MAG: hypothetical protein V2A54_05595 [Bacteroidota bacterium]
MLLFKKHTYSLILLLATSFVTPLFSQQIDCFDSLYTRKKYSVSFNFEYENGSNCITNYFFKTFYQGGFIDSSLKEQVYNKLKSYNRFGNHTEGGFQFTHMPDTFLGQESMGYYIGLRSVMHTDIGFTDDLFKLIFGGNKSFTGKTADFGGSAYNSIRYHQLQLGLIKRYDLPSSSHIFSIGFGINAGYDHKAMIFDKGTLYTDTMGSYLDFSSAYQYFSSDTSNTGLFNIKGIGTSVFLAYTWSDKSGNRIRFSVDDFGNMKWSPRSYHNSGDTTYHFEGIKVTDLFGIDSTFLDGYAPDTIIDKYVFYNPSGFGYTTNLPVLFSLAYTRTFSKKLNLTTILRYRAMGNSIPQGILKAQYFPSANAAASVMISYGGYATFSAGLEAAYNFGKGTVGMIGSTYLSGYNYPKKTSSQGLYFKVLKYF